jgi:hypothetical protein
MNNIEQLQTDEYWNKKWDDIFEKYQSDLRHGYYIASMLNDKVESVLEIGAGSFRDISLISQFGKSIGAFDFSNQACQLAQKKYPDLASKFWCDDAFSINLKDSAYDASYSNGFIGCFDDKKIENLLLEQIRVTKYQIFVTVHNGHNAKFKDYFNQKKMIDSLYEIRFFSILDLENIFNKFPFQFKIYPVGKAYKELEDILIANESKLRDIRECILSQGLSTLTTSERLMVVVDLNN